MQKNNKGVLFKNKKKETEKHPDYTGSATINSQEFDSFEVELHFCICERLAQKFM